MSIFLPSERTAKWVNPRSMPVSTSTGGSGVLSTWTTNDTKYRPAASKITVTDDGSQGSTRDQRTGTSPTFGSRSLPLGSTVNRELRVNRTACRVSLRDRNRGGATRQPFRFPDTELK